MLTVLSMMWNSASFVDSAAHKVMYWRDKLLDEYNLSLKPTAISVLETSNKLEDLVNQFVPLGVLYENLCIFSSVNCSSFLQLIVKVYAELLSENLSTDRNAIIGKQPLSHILT